MSAKRLRPAERPVAAIPPGAPATNGHGSGSPLLPTVLSTGRPLREITKDALAALVAANTPPKVFQRDGQLVRIRRDERGQPLIERLGLDARRGVLERAAQFLAMDRHGALRPIAPPEVVVKDVASLPAWPGIPRLAGITESPVLRPDGSVLSGPGYDVVTGLYYAPAPGLIVSPVPDHPATEEIAQAKAVLDEALTDFHFADAASYANACAALLTPLLRPAISGRTPLFVFDAPVKGTGKSALAEMIEIVATGGHAGALPEFEDDAEARKRYTTLLREGVTLAVLDDVRRRLDSPVLSVMVTVPRWRDRLLGSNTSGVYENQIVLIACGNNVQVGGDMARRVVWVRLDTKLAQPWRRSEFARPDLPAWTRAHRGDLIWAAFTLARAWWSSGCPVPHVPAFAGFGAWTRVVGGVLETAGITGLLGNLDAVTEQSDEQEAEVEQFLRAWYRMYGDAPVRVAQIAIDVVAGTDELRDALPGYLAEFADERGQRKLAHRLGNLLRRVVDRRYGDDGLHVERAGEDGHQKIGLWRVVTDSQPPEDIPDAPGPEPLPIPSAPRADDLFAGRPAGLPVGVGRFACARCRCSWTDEARCPRCGGPCADLGDS